MKFKRLLALETMYLQNTIPPACSIHQRPRINTIAPHDQFNESRSVLHKSSDYWRLFAIIRHYSYYSLFAVRYSRLFAVRYSLFATIRYSPFGFSRHPDFTATAHGHTWCHGCKHLHTHLAARNTLTREISRPIRTILVVDQIVCVSFGI